MSSLLVEAKLEDDDISTAMHLTDISAALPKEARRLEKTRYSYQYGSVGILTLYGPIFPRANMMTEMSGATSVERWSAEFNDMAAREDLRSILLLVDSPGGDVRGIQEAADMVFKTRKSGKPVVAYVAGYNASAAYWITSAASQIVSDVTGVTGSIGVVIHAEKDADGSITLTSKNAKNKRPDLTTDEGKAVVQTLLDDIEGVFLSTVARNRNTTVDSIISDYGQGDVFVAKRAKKAGMIDSIASLGATLKALAVNGDPSGKLKAALEPEQSMEGESESVMSKFKNLFASILGNNNPSADAEKTEESTEQPESVATAEGQTVVAKPSRREYEEALLARAELKAVKAVTGHSLHPAVEQHLTGLFLTALVDDSMHAEKVIFVSTQGQMVEGTRVEQVETLAASLPKQDLTEERLKAVEEGKAKALVLPEATIEAVSKNGITEERKRELLGQGELGRQILAEQQQGRK